MPVEAEKPVEVYASGLAGLSTCSKTEDARKNSLWPPQALKCGIAAEHKTQRFKRRSTLNPRFFCHLLETVLAGTLQTILAATHPAVF